MSRSSSASAKTELETVVNWPLLLSAASAAAFLAVVPIAIACIAALKGRSVKDSVATVLAVPKPKLAQAAPTTILSPAAVPASSKQLATQKPAPREVYFKAVQSPIPPDPTPIPKVAKTPLPPKPESNPILQVREEIKPIFKRLDKSAEQYLVALLYETFEEVDLENVEGTRAKLIGEPRDTRKDTEEKKPGILVLRAERPDLKGLPMREGAACQARPEALRKMQEISTTLRRELDRPSARISASGHMISQRAGLLQKRLQSSVSWFQDDGISTLAQMLQVEDVGSRVEFIRRLSKVQGSGASVLLARQALFDLSWTIREEAIQALKDRPREHYRQVLLDALRYPWAPVAAHAAEALAALHDGAAISPLADMLDLPDPCSPVQVPGKKWVVAEVVKINHLRNCLLCHPPSTSQRDMLRAIVPTPGRPLPRSYYNDRKGDFVRADITYLSQDFSQILRVDKPDKWPEWQRFDFLVRQRELTADEVAAHKNHARSKNQRSSYPQRKAVLFALRELTGLDAGELSDDWYELLCLPAVPARP